MEQQKNEISAAPTKDFFITMLVKDIILHQAILDLIDNCIDGAIGLRGKNGDYEGLYVHITINDESFEISDNCGGFSVEVAQKYAFRFGRPSGAPQLGHSVGRFGVGMKRALFKLGKLFSIQSTCKVSKFEMTVNVDEWENDPDSWYFKFDYTDESPQNGELGTKITVRNLHEGISEKFKLPNFINFLGNEIQKKNEEWMERNLEIKVNDITLVSNPAKMFFSEEIKPAYLSLDYNEVNVKLFAGLAKSGQPKEAGWYIYCNNRLIVQADQTELSGWGDGAPRFHNTYAMFRGYVYFNADNSYLLPWNTTKSGIDQDSEIFRSIRLEMIKMMHPVIDYLKRLKASDTAIEVDADNEEGLTRLDDNTETLEQLIHETSIQRVTTIDVEKLSHVFSAPQPKIIKKPDSQKIQYSKPLSQINRAKKVLNVSTLKEVGEKTFDYFYKSECED